jgi:hypothetical protein
MIVGLAFHILAAVIWVGGMFFAHMCLRPSAGPLEPTVRLPLWHRVLSRFFPWVWLSILALLASGFAMVFLGFGGRAAVGIVINDSDSLTDPACRTHADRGTSSRRLDIVKREVVEHPNTRRQE